MSAPPFFNNPKYHYTHHLLIPHPGGQQVVLQSQPDGWALPSFEPKEHDLTRVGHINRHTQRALGLTTVVRRRYALQIDREVTKRVDSTYLLENLDPTWAPPADFHWVGFDALQALPFRDAAQQRLVAAWFEAEARGDREPRQPSWFEAGWYRQVCDWIEGHLVAHGYTKIGPLEQVRHWHLSALLKLPTDQGTLYFKAALAPIFVQEPAITQALARRFPDRVPIPLAIDRSRGWMLMSEFQGALFYEATLEEWQSLLGLLAEMQQWSATEAEALIADGCEDRRLHILASQVNELLTSPILATYLDAEQLAQLRDLAPRLQEGCHTLASYGIPQTLVHGDFHAGNVARHAAGYVIFDWTDACLAHPFFDVACLVDGYSFEEHPELIAPVRDFYLACWERYETPERVRAAWEEAARLSALHQLVSYINIIRNIEPGNQSEFSSALTSWAETLLKLMAPAP